MTLELVRQNRGEIPDCFFAASRWDAEHAAIDAMQTNWAQMAYRDPFDRSQISIADRVKSMIDRLQQRIEANVARRWETSTIVRLPWSSQRLFAWDLDEILRNELFPHRRKIEFDSECGLWPALFHGQDDVLVIAAANLGNVIQPSPTCTINLCSECQDVPIHRDCLITTIKGIDDGMTFRRKHAWRRDQNSCPFSKCTAEHRHGHYNRVQTVVKSSTQGKPLVPFSKQHYKGAIIFGNPKLFRADKCGTTINEGHCAQFRPSTTRIRTATGGPSCQESGERITRENAVAALET